VLIFQLIQVGKHVVSALKALQQQFSALSLSGRYTLVVFAMEGFPLIKRSVLGKSR
jgi:hypothetical protein